MLKDEARVVNADERKKDFETRELDKRRKKDEKKEKRKLEEDEAKEVSKRVHVNAGGASSGSGKRKADDYPEGEEKRLEMVADEVIEEEVVKQWVCEAEDIVKDEEDEDDGEKAWDDVKDAESDVKEVRVARKEGSRLYGKEEHMDR